MALTAETVIAEQYELIEQLREAKADGYWCEVYDAIFAAWEAFALAELGTRTPSHADLEGRPELAALYEAIR